MIEGDGQHDPRDIHQLIGPIVSRAVDVMIGLRYVKGSSVEASRNPN